MIGRRLDNLRVVAGDYLRYSEYDGYKTVKKPMKLNQKSLFDSVESTLELRVEKVIMHQDYFKVPHKRNHDIVLIKITEESYRQVLKTDRKFARAACLPSRMVESANL